MIPAFTAHASKTLITTFFYCLLSSLSGILPVLAQCMLKENQISQVFYSIRTESSLPQRKDKFSLVVPGSEDKMYRYYALMLLGMLEVLLTEVVVSKFKSEGNERIKS